MKIKRNDTVTIIAGADRGKSGKVLKAMPKLNKVLVEGINMKKKHVKARQSNKKGQTIELAMPINASNVVVK